MEYWTIAYDGEIGNFQTFTDRDLAESTAKWWRVNHPNHTYEVVPEDPDEIAAIEER